MTSTPGAVPDLFPGAPQRVAGLDLHAIAGRPSTTPWLRSYPDVPPRARSAPRGAMTLALAPTFARHAEHALAAALFMPRNYRPLIASPVLFTLRSRQPTPSRSRRTSTVAKTKELEAKLAKKDNVIAEISAEYVQLKKELGEP
jgi:hypothetical protein